MVNIGNPANNNDAAPVGNVGNHANNNDPPDVVDEQSNQLNDAVLNDHHEVADGQLIEAVVGNGNIETHYAAIHKDGTTLTAPTINYLNDQLEIRDKRITELEAKIVDLERMMTALSETVGDFKCTSVDSNSRFSHLTCLTMTGFSLNEGLNFVGQGRHEGDKEVGDEEEDSGNGDQKRNACKRKHAPEGQEGKRDNKEDENGNGDQKPKARKKKCLKS